MTALLRTLAPAVAGVLLLVGCGTPAPDKNAEKQAYEDAKKYYGDIGHKGPGAAPGGTSPATSRPGASTEMDARMQHPGGK